jgi:hypothetical protein
MPASAFLIKWINFFTMVSLGPPPSLLCFPFSLVFTIFEF